MNEGTFFKTMLLDCTYSLHSLVEIWLFARLDFVFFLLVRRKIPSELDLAHSYVSCTNYNVCDAATEIRLRLGNAQINLAFLSPCTNFADSKKR